MNLPADCMNSMLLDGCTLTFSDGSSVAIMVRTVNVRTRSLDVTCFGDAQPQYMSGPVEVEIEAVFAGHVVPAPLPPKKSVDPEDTIAAKMSRAIRFGSL